ALPLARSRPTLLLVCAPCGQSSLTATCDRDPLDATSVSSVEQTKNTQDGVDPCSPTPPASTSVTSTSCSSPMKRQRTSLQLGSGSRSSTQNDGNTGCRRLTRSCTR